MQYQENRKEYIKNFNKRIIRYFIITNKTERITKTTVVLWHL